MDRSAGGVKQEKVEERLLILRVSTTTPIRKRRLWQPGGGTPVGSSDKTLKEERGSEEGQTRERGHQRGEEKAAVTKGKIDTKAGRRIRRKDQEKGKRKEEDGNTNG